MPEPMRAGVPRVPIRPPARSLGVEAPIEVDALTVTDSAGAALRLAANTTATGLDLSGTPGGIALEGGAGRLSGVTRDPAPALRFADPARCADWDTAGLLDGAGAPATDDCGR